MKLEYCSHITWPKTAKHGNPTSSQKFTRMFFHVLGTDVKDHIDERQIKAMRKEQWRIAREKVKELTDGSRVQFSEVAGCSCGCKPGFITNGIVKDENGEILDITLVCNKVKEQ